MIRINKDILKSSLYGIAFFVFTIAYADLGVNYNLWNNIKYVSIILIMTISITNHFDFRITEQDAFYILYFIPLSIICCVTQGLSLSEMIYSVFYIGTLVFYLVYGKYCFTNGKSMIYAGIGIFFAVIFVLSLSQSEIVYQLTVGVEGRKRLFGLFSHANILGSMLLMSVIFLNTARYSTKNNRLKYIIINLIIATEILIIILTDSRTTMICLFMYFAWILYSHLRMRFQGKNRLLFTLFILIVAAAFIYFFYMEYISNQTTFWTRMDDYLDISFTPLSFIFGQYLTGSAMGTSFEFAPYTVMYRMGLLGIIGFIVVFTCLWRKRLCLSGDRKVLYCATLLAFMVSLLGEAYIVNVTHLFSCGMYTLIGSIGYNQNILEMDNG